MRGTTAAPEAVFVLAEDFYPRTPCGVRPSSLISFILMFFSFLSTYPVRGTTVYVTAPDTIIKHFYPRTPCGVRLKPRLDISRAVLISIHVPRAGYDLVFKLSELSQTYFYPRTPCGVRQQSVTNQTICFVYLPKTIEAPGKCFSIFPLKWHIMPTNPVRRCLGFRESLTFALEY